MSQAVLLERFSEYLNLKKTEVKSQYDPRLVDSLIQAFDAHGFCMGFALSYSIMNYLGKLALWRAMLVAVHSWNGKLSTLKNNYVLPGGKKRVLEDILEELIHAVTFYQADTAIYSFLNEEDSWSDSHYRLAYSVPTIDFNSFSYNNILGAGVHFFELVNGEGQLEHIQADARIEDQFSLEALIYVLDAEVIKDCICLIHSRNHATSVTYTKPFWQVYDSNYSHDSAVNLDKLFSEKEEVAKEIIRILGNKLTIKLASLKQETKLKQWTESFETFKQGQEKEVYKDLLAIKDNDLLHFIPQLQVHEAMLSLTALEVSALMSFFFIRKRKTLKN